MPIVWVFQEHSQQPTPNMTTQTLTQFSANDFIPLPPGNAPLIHRGVQFSRSTILRLAESKKIKLAKMRLTGGVQSRRYILSESLDKFLDDQIAAQFGDSAK